MNKNDNFVNYNNTNWILFFPNIINKKIFYKTNNENNNFKEFKTNKEYINIWFENDND